MALSYVEYVGNGTTGPYTVTFGFLDRTHVTVYVEGVSAAFTWLSDTSIQLDVAASNGNAILIQRVTPRTSLLTDFQDASVLTEADLDNNSKQIFYLAQETEDYSADTRTQLEAALVSNGNVSPPADPGDDFKLLMAENGAWSWVVTLGSFFRNTFASVADATAGRTALGLGTIATQASDSVTITGGSITGVSSDLMPIGAIIDYAGVALPAGNKWAWADGSTLDSVADTTLADLYTAVGTLYGGTNSASFNLPDLRGRTSFGKDNMGGSTASRMTAADDGITGTVLGATGGDQTQTLVEGNLPAHNHKMFGADGDFSGTVNLAATSVVAQRAGNAVDEKYDLKRSDEASATLGETADTGSGSAFGIVPPGIILNKIIKVRN